MQEYDVALKLLLHGSATSTLRQLTGTAVTKWLDVELPKVQKLRLDLLGETIDGGLIHLELQSSNDTTMPLRMAEYCLGVRRLFGRFPRQIVLHVGEPPLRMENELRDLDVLFRYRITGIRILNGDRLLESEDVGDNIIAILAGLRDREEAVRKIVKRIARIRGQQRETAMAQLLILAGLWHLEKTVQREARKMPIEADIREHQVLGPLFKEAHAEGREEGVQAGRKQGVQEGELTVLRRQIQKRFGRLPKWAGEKLAALSTTRLENLSERVLDAKSLDELLK